MNAPTASSRKRFAEHSSRGRRRSGPDPRARKIVIIGKSRQRQSCRRPENPAFADAISRSAARLEPSNESSPRSSAPSEKNLPANMQRIPTERRRAAPRIQSRRGRTTLRTQAAAQFLPETLWGKLPNKIGKPRQCLQGLAVPSTAEGQSRRRKGSGVRTHGCGPPPSPSNLGCG